MAAPVSVVEVSAPVPTPTSLVSKLSRVYAFALPEREAAELVALCMRASRAISAAEQFFELAKDGIFPDITDDDEGELRRSINDWLKVIKS